MVLIIIEVRTDSETIEITEYKLGNLTIYDSLSLGDDKERDIVHAKKITKLLSRQDSEGNVIINLVIVIVDFSLYLEKNATTESSLQLIRQMLQ